MKQKFFNLLDRIVVLLWIYVPVEGTELRMANVVNPLYWVFITIVLFISVCIDIFRSLLEFYCEILETDLQSFSFKQLWLKHKEK